MSLQAAILAAFIILNAGLIIALRLWSGTMSGAAGKALAVVSLLVLPWVSFSFSTAHHFERAKTTEFCLSCHVMEPYGRSLYIDSAEHVPASHFQNRRVPADQACYTCHTSYTMFGDVQAKVNGVRHLYVNYFGTIPEPLTLYQPYRNRECLHCHGGARSFEDQGFHADMRAGLDSDEFSCLACHASGHAVDEVDSLPRWSQPAHAEAGGR